MAERWSQLNWRSVGVWAMGMTLAALFLTVIGLAIVYLHYDFSFFYYAFHVVWSQQNPAMLYSVSHEREWLTQLGYGEMTRSFGLFDQYVYPPQFAVAFSWLAALPYPTACDIWEVASVGAYVAGVHWMVCLACPHRSVAFRILLYVTGAIQLPYLWDFLIGNSNWLIFFLLALAFHLNSNRMPWVAGIPLGLAVVFKVTPIVVLLYYLMKRDWRMPLVAVCTGALCTVTSAAVVGWNPILKYAASIGALSAQSMRNGPAPYNSSLHGILQLWHLNTNQDVFHHSVDVAFALYAGIVVLLVAIAIRQRRWDNRGDIAISTLSMLLLSPLVEGPHMVYSLFALFMVMGRALPGRSHRTLLRLRTVAVIGVVVILSPLGWTLRSVFQTEYFVVLCILFAVSYGQNTRLGRNATSDAVPAN